ncbi:MAG: 3-phosphoshikimate 1-carboxyvinyltransferase [Planctomycetota bacterium]|nr:3-phosphoshikimate 1-carboxyvinyltransferase [Planctomycetota bacterium]
MAASKGTQTINPLTGPFHVALRVPGSKSLTNRALVLAGLAQGTSRLQGVLRSDDTDATMNALKILGADVQQDDDSVTINITGIERFQPDRGTIDMGAGGTPARFMIAVASLTEAPVVIDGTPRLRERPMAGLIEMLEELGANIEPLGPPGYLPIRMHPGEMRGGRLRVKPQASSQFISALMLIGPRLPGGIELNFDGPPTSESYIRLTISELKAWGVDVQAIEDGAGHLNSVIVKEGAIQPQSRGVPADASSALYWAALATICNNSRVELHGLDPSDGQPDHQAIAALGRIGLQLELEGDHVTCTNGGRHQGWGDLDASGMPDGAMALAIVAACASDPTRLMGLETLRVKECDRVAALDTELRKTGADVTVDGDDLVIRPPSDQQATASPCTIETYDDHRMAMAFSILGLRQGGLTIEDPDCVAKSYPGFWDDLARVEAAGSRGDTR